MSVIEQTHAALDAPAELPPLPTFNRPDAPTINPMVQQQMLADQHAARLQAVAAQYALQQQQQQAYQQQLAAQNQHQQQQQLQQGHPQQQQQQMRAPSDGSVGHGSPAVNGQSMLPPQTNGRPPILKRPSSQNGTHANGQAQAQGQGSQGLQNVAIAQGQGQGQQVRPALSPTYQMQMNGSPQLLPNGKPLIGPNGQMDPNMQRMLAARLAQQQQQQQQQQRQQSEDGTNQNSNPNPNPAPAPSITAANAQQVLSQMTAEQAQQITALADKGGFNGNVAAFLEHRNKAQQMQKQKQQAAALQAQAQAQAQAGAGVGAGNGNQSQNQNARQPSNGSNSDKGGNDNFASPQLPSGSLNLKLPAHATARLGNKPQPSSPAQRAQ
jgi:hypothetical protein